MFYLNVKRLFTCDGGKYATNTLLWELCKLKIILLKIFNQIIFKFSKMRYNIQ